MEHFREVLECWMHIVRAKEYKNQSSNNGDRMVVFAFLVCFRFLILSEIIAVSLLEATVSSVKNWNFVTFFCGFRKKNV